MGGLSEKAFKLRQISRNSRGKVINVDSGNVLFSSSGSFLPDSAEAIAARAIAEVYAQIGYDAVGIGAKDLAAGLGILQAAYDHGVNWTSANLYDSNGVRLYKPYQEKTVDGLTIAIVGITGPVSAENAEYRISDPVEELAALMPSLEQEFDMLLLLSTLPMKKNLALARQFPQIDIIVGADNSRGNVAPVLAGNALVTQTANRGQYLGALTVKFNDEPWEKPLSAQQNNLAKQLKSLNLQINRLGPSMAGLPEKSGDMKKLEAQRTQVQKKLDDLNRNIRSGTTGDAFSTYRCDFLKLQQTGRTDAQIEYIVERAQKQIKAARNK